jgi:hypothetical protein
VGKRGGGAGGGKGRTKDKDTAGPQTDKTAERQEDKEKTATGAEDTGRKPFFGRPPPSLAPLVFVSDALASFFASKPKCICAVVEVADQPNERGRGWLVPLWAPRPNGNWRGDEEAVGGDEAQVPDHPNAMPLAQPCNPGPAASTTQREKTQKRSSTRNNVKSNRTWISCFSPL